LCEYTGFLFLSADIRKGVSEMTKGKFFVLGMLVALLTFGFVLASCDTGTGGGGSDVWTNLLGTWESDDGHLKYEFENLGPNKAISLTAPDGLPNLDIETVTDNTISGIWEGDDKTFSFNFVLSNNNQTLTITKYVHDGIAKPQRNGVLTKRS
jgi:hypothetical protein